MPTIHYGLLHNRKTAGTALKEVIAQQKKRTPDVNITAFEHAITFPRLITEFPDIQAIFFVREPISRFISGFYSRLREGKPRYFYPWNRKEKRAFRRFQHPNQLAEALSSFNPLKRYFAITAMKSIGHVKHTYKTFLGSIDYLNQHAERIAFIGHQPDFSDDLSRLRTLLNIDQDITPPEDNVAAHRNPDNLDKTLSAKAVANLEQWYKEDIKIYQWCLKKRASLLSLP